MRLEYCLALSTVTKDCSISVGQICNQGLESVVELYEVLPYRDHDQVVFALLEQLAQKIDFNQLSSIVVSEGPGSFTGVRIGIAVAEGISIGKNLLVHRVCALQSMILQGLARYDGKALVAQKVKIIAGLMGNGVGGYYIRLFDETGWPLEGVKSFSAMEAVEYLSTSNMLVFSNETVEELDDYFPGYIVAPVQSSGMILSYLTSHYLLDK